MVNRKSRTTYFVNEWSRNKPNNKRRRKKKNSNGDARPSLLDKLNGFADVKKAAISRNWTRKKKRKS